MKQRTTLKGRIVQHVAKLATYGPWRNTAESLTCTIGRNFPTSKVVISLCRHMGSQLLEREGTQFGRVATFTSGGKMFCSGLNGISTTSILYYFLGTINNQAEDERPIEELLLRATRRGDTFLDIGANYGFYSFLLGSLCGKSGAVHAFDANPVLRQHLVRSAELNKATAHIIINTVAIGSTNREHVILYDPERIGCSSLYQHEWLDTKTSVAIPQITIDDYRKRNNITRIDIVKVDIEGAELDAFRGMEETFRICPPGLIVCELMLLTTSNRTHSPSDPRRASSSANPVEILELLGSKGYEARYIQDSGGRLGGVVTREHLERLSQPVINVAFVRPDLKTSRPDLFAAG